MMTMISLAEIPREQLPALLAELLTRLLEPAPTAPTVSDKLLTVEQAATRLSVSPEWLYRRAKRLGAIKLDTGTLRFSEAALDAYIKQQAISATPVRRRRAA
jgi:excisionase family DNA binding protein